MTLPSLFLSHGAPTLPLTDTPARTFLAGLGQVLPRPKAILVVSAHWETERPAVNAVGWNETIHDFYGFPRPLYELRYHAPGSPALAEAIGEKLRQSGFGCDIDRKRGLDHGAWVPLLLMYPQADIPVLQLSVQPHLGPEHHLRVGAALASLRDQGVMIIGSGSMTHNLAEFRGHGPNDPAPDWVNSFADWFDAALRADRRDDLVHYKDKAPFARKNHPTEEHLVPLYVAIGAAGPNMRTERLHSSSTYGVLRMDVYAFGAEQTIATQETPASEHSSLQQEAVSAAAATA
jgi:4,5-DOPA dioxygenase extradiol